MRKKRRFVSLLLMLALLCSILPVSAMAAGKPYIRQVEAGKWTSWAVTSNGDLYGWGQCITAGLFNGKTGSNVPVKLMSGIKSVSASSVENQPAFEVKNYDDYGYISHYQEPGTVLTIIKENGDLYTWGDNTCFQLGKGYYEAEQETYEPYFVMSDVVKAATSDHACAAVTESGDLYYWGYNLVYGYGNSAKEHYPEPTLILTGVKDVELSEYNVVALKEDGSVWMMGGTHYGALARDEGKVGSLVNEMTKVMDGCKDIASGAGFTMALKTDGTLYGWGSNSFATLGIHWNKAEYVATPTVVSTDVKSVDAGNHNAYFIKNDNSLWVTGDGQRGQRGQGNNMSYYDTVSNTYKLYRYYPEQIDSNVHSVSAGVNHMLYLKNDGTMWGCGGPEHAGEGGSRLGRGDVWGEDLTPYGFGFTAYQWHVTQCGLSYGTFAGQFGPIQEEVELVAGFSDIAANAYYRDAVEWAVDEGITTGTGDTTFSPDQDCTRAQIITFLWRAAGSPQTSTIAIIEDIDPSQFYFDAVTWAAEQGIVEDGEDFRPNDPCTRAMAVEFMWRAAGFQAISMDTGFTDVSVSASYSTAVEWAVHYGITTGTSDTTFSPDTVCSRGQIVTFLYRASSENLL